MVTLISWAFNYVCNLYAILRVKLHFTEPRSNQAKSVAAGEPLQKFPLLLRRINFRGEAIAKNVKSQEIICSHYEDTCTR